MHYLRASAAGLATAGVLLLASEVGAMEVVTPGGTPTSPPTTTVAPTIQLYDSEQPGSVLVFPKFLRGSTFVDGVSIANSAFHIGVVCPYGVTCQNDQPVFLNLEWVGLGDSKNVCPANNFTIKTSVNDKLVFSANGQIDADSGGGNIPQPPTVLGYLIAWVTNSIGQPIKFDGLFGDAIVRESATNVEQYSAVKIQAISQLATGALVPTTPGIGGLPSLTFDGQTGYKAVTGQFVEDVRYDNHDISAGDIANNYLIMLTLDVFSGQPNPTTHVGLEFFNQKQVGISDSVEFVCWTETPLSILDPDLTVQNIGSKNGIVVSTPAFQLPSGKPATLLSIFEVDEGPDAGADVFARGWFISGTHGPNGVPTLFETDEP